MTLFVICWFVLLLGLFLAATDEHYPSDEWYESLTWISRLMFALTVAFIPLYLIAWIMRLIRWPFGTRPSLESERLVLSLFYEQRWVFLGLLAAVWGMYFFRVAANGVKVTRGGCDRNMLYRELFRPVYSLRVFTGSCWEQHKHVLIVSPVLVLFAPFVTLAVFLRLTDTRIFGYRIEDGFTDPLMWINLSWAALTLMLWIGDVVSVNRSFGTTYFTTPYPPHFRVNRTSFFVCGICFACFGIQSSLSLLLWLCG